MKLQRRCIPKPVEPGRCLRILAGGAIVILALLAAVRPIPEAVAAGTDLTVFVTNETFIPGTQPGLLSGLGDADQKCQDRAQAASLSGTFKAWLSDDLSDAAERQGHSLTRYLLVDGTTVVASDWTDLTDGTLLHAIDLDEYGNPTSGAAVWTGTAAAGTKLDSNNCGLWFSSVGTGRQGTTSGVDASWTTSADGDCSVAARLYCFQQCPDVDLDTICDAPPTTSTTTTSTTTSTTNTTTTLPPDGFEFVAGDLNDGTRYGGYADALELANGTPPYECTVDAGTVSVDGTPYSSLAAIGLRLDKADGTVSGIPLVAGEVAFQATCADASRAVARSADGSTTHQVITFDIDGASGIRQSSAFVLDKLQIRLSAAGKESLSASGFVDLGGAEAASLLRAAVSFRVLDYVSPTVTLDGKRNAATARGVTPSVKASIDKKGQFKISITKGTIPLGVASGSTVDFVVELRVGDVVKATQVVRCSVKGTVPKQTISFASGKSPDLGGSFMVTAVSGKDSKEGTGTSWKVGFMHRPPAGVSVSGVASATVELGSSSYQLPLVSKRSKLSSVKGRGKDQASISLDSVKGKGGYTLPIVPSASSGIPLAGSGGVTATFQTKILLNGPGGTPVLIAENSTRIIGTKRNSWIRK